jgi:hypothetical protein
MKLVDWSHGLFKQLILAQKEIAVSNNKMKAIKKKTYHKN